MSLGVGARLGHYAVTAKIGEGGMGEVWRATDTQLNRDVALKILPEAFAADPDLARFVTGVSGNPRGRPKLGLSIAERIREKGGQDGGVFVDLLFDIATNPKEATRHRIEALKVLLQRGFGAIPTEVSVEEQPLVINADQVRKLLEQENLLDEIPEPAATELERARSERVDDWLHSRWPPHSQPG